MEEVQKMILLCDKHKPFKVQHQMKQYDFARMLNENSMALRMISKVHQDYCLRSMVVSNGEVNLDVIIHPLKMKLFSKEYGIED